MRDSANPRSEIQNPKSVHAETLDTAHLSTERSTNPTAYFRRTAALAAQAAEALHYAHELGVTHRDVKPANLLVDRRGELWITDFGLARIEGADNLTLTGDQLGTLRYMSPEQASGNRLGVDHRTDIYSLGATLYEVLTLSPAITGNGREHLLHQILQNDPTPLRRLDRRIPADLETITLKALAKDPADRYRTAADMAADLRHYLDHQQIRARPATVLQSVVKWSRRNRAFVRTASASVAVICLIALAAAWWIDSANREARAERTIRQSEQVRLDAAQRQLDEQNYVAQISVAAHALERHDLSTVGDVLDDLLPKTGQRDVRGFEGHYLWNLFQRRPVTFAVHQGEAYCARFSPAGNWLATSGADGVRIWNWPSRTLAHRLTDQKGDVNGVAWSPDGKFLVSLSDDFHARVYRSSDWTQEQDLTFAGQLVAAAFTPDGSTLVLAERRWTVSDKESHGDNRVHIVDSRSWRVRGELKGPIQRLQGVAVSADGRWTAAASDDDAAFVWDLATLQLKHRLANPLAVGAPRGSGNNGVAFAHHNSRLAVATDSGGVRIYDAASGELESELPPQAGATEGVTFTPDDQGLIVVGRGRQTVVWEFAPPGVWHESAVFPHLGPLWSVAAHPDGSIVTTDRGGALWVHNRFAPLDRRRLIAGADAVQRGLSTVHTDGQTYSESSLRWAAAEQQPTGQGEIIALAWSPDGQELAVSGSPGTVSFWNLESGGPVELQRTAESDNSAIAYSPGGRYLALGSLRGGVQLFERKPWRLVASILTPLAFANFAFTPDERTLVGSTVKPEGPLVALKVPTLARATDYAALASQAQFLLHSASAEDLAFFLRHEGLLPDPPAWGLYGGDCSVSHDGQVIATYKSEDRFQVWAAPDWHCRTLFAGSGQNVVHLALSPEGRTLAALTTIGQVELFNTFTGRLMLTLQSRLLGTHRISFSANGRHLVAIGYGVPGQPELVVWDAPR